MGDMHHFVSLPTNLKLWKNESYPRIPHENRNNLPWPKKWFSDFVSRKTTVRSGTSLDFCYCMYIFFWQTNRQRYCWSLESNLLECQGIRKFFFQPKCRLCSLQEKTLKAKIKVSWLFKREAQWMFWDQCYHLGP